MDLNGLFVLALFITLFAMLLGGFPVAFTLAGTSLIFAIIGSLAGILDFSFVTFFPDRIFGIIQNELLLALPLFIAMGVVLERSRVAEDLLQSMGALFGRFRGGLGLSVTLVGALLAASTGIVGATVVTMGVLSLPTMLARGYDRRLAAGSIAAAGTLGQIIPPSIVLILLADVMSSAYQLAQREQGVFSPKSLSVGELFAGALMPGLLLVGLYLCYQVAVALIRPASSPPLVDRNEAEPPFAVARLLAALLPPLLLILAVLGSILGGVATPTEASSVGAVGAILLGARRLAPTRSALMSIGIVALMLLFTLPTLVDYRQDGLSVFLLIALLCLLAIVAIIVAIATLWQQGVLRPVLKATVNISTMVYTVFIGAALFSLVFRGFHGEDYIEALLGGLPGGSLGALAAVMLVMFLLGFFLDFIEIIFVIVPLVAPILLAQGIDPVWLAILMAVNLQTSFLTPPFGFALFYLRGVAPPEVTTGDIYRGALPYVMIQLIGLGLVAALPGIALWLPRLLYS